MNKVTEVELKLDGIKMSNGIEALEDKMKHSTRESIFAICMEMMACLIFLITHYYSVALFFFCFSLVIFIATLRLNRYTRKIINELKVIEVDFAIEKASWNTK